MTRSVDRRVAMLVLAQLGLGACSKPPMPPAETAAPLEIPPMPPAARPATTAPRRAPPPATAAAPPVPEEEDDDLAPRPPPMTGNECGTAGDCMAGTYCKIPKGRRLGTCKKIVPARP